jgi:outer membrane receptor protein involved in Fe transport
VRVFTEVLATSSQFEGAGLPRNDGYTVVNLGGSYRVPWRAGILEELVVHLRIVNLLDEDYSEVLGFPALGTHVVAGLRARF